MEYCDIDMNVRNSLENINLSIRIQPNVTKSQLLLAQEIVNIIGFDTWGRLTLMSQSLIRVTSFIFLQFFFKLKIQRICMEDSLIVFEFFKINLLLN